MGTENFSIADMAAVCKDGNCCNGMNNWMNNPFMYLIWLAYMGNGGFGFGNNRAGETVQNAEIMNQIGSLRSQIQDNQNTNAILQGQQAQTQTILNTLNNHWTQDLQAKYADAKLELSQQQQNATLIAALKTT